MHFKRFASKREGQKTIPFNLWLNFKQPFKTIHAKRVCFATTHPLNQLKEIHEGEIQSPKCQTIRYVERREKTSFSSKNHFNFIITIHRYFAIELKHLSCCTPDEQSP